MTNRSIIHEIKLKMNKMIFKIGDVVKYREHIGVISTITELRPGGYKLLIKRWIKKRDRRNKLIGIKVVWDTAYYWQCRLVDDPLKIHNLKIKFTKNKL